MRYEPTPGPEHHDFLRRVVLAATSATDAHVGARSRARMAVFVTISLVMIAAPFLGSRVWSVFVGDLQGAAVRFEVRLAENAPAAGLREAEVSGSHRSVFLHDEVIVTNSDIAAARVIPGSGASQYSIDIEFKPAGAEKMRSATKNNIGKLLAILLDGQAVMALVLRSPVGASAMITGDFTRPEAERIVHGIQIQ